MPESLSSSLAQHVRQLVQQGKQREAIERLVQETTWSLKQAKDYVEQLIAGANQA